jgi:hypothetical protein
MHDNKFLNFLIEITHKLKSIIKSYKKKTNEMQKSHEVAARA